LLIVERLAEPRVREALQLPLMARAKLGTALIYTFANGSRADELCVVASVVAGDRICASILGAVYEGLAHEERDYELAYAALYGRYAAAVCLSMTRRPQPDIDGAPAEQIYAEALSLLQMEVAEGDPRLPSTASYARAFAEDDPGRAAGHIKEAKARDRLFRKEFRAALREYRYDQDGAKYRAVVGRLMARFQVGGVPPVPLAERAQECVLV